MAPRLVPSSEALEASRAYLAHEWNASLVEPADAAVTLLYDHRLRAAWAQGDLRAVCTALKFRRRTTLRRSLDHRARSLLRGRPASARLGADRELEPGLVLLARRSRSVVALRPHTERVTKVEPTNFDPAVLAELEVLEHMQRHGPRDLSPEVLDGGTHPDGRHAFLTTRLWSDSHAVLPRHVRRVLPGLTDRLFAFYASWGLRERPVADYVTALHASLARLDPSLAMAVAAWLEWLGRRAGLRRMVLTRAHGDLSLDNVRRRRGRAWLLDWGNTVEASPLYDLFVPFAYHFFRAAPAEQRRLVSGRAWFQVSDANTTGLATPFLRRAAEAMGRAIDEHALAFHFVTCLAERILWAARTHGTRPWDDRVNAPLLASLLSTYPPTPQVRTWGSNSRRCSSPAKRSVMPAK